MAASTTTTINSNLKPNQFINDRYKVVTALNHGSFGSVSLAKDTWARNSLVAVKCINKQKGSCPNSEAIEEAREEIAIHKRLGHHKYICSLIDSFEDDEATYLVMEYCSEGDLYEAIRAGKGPTYSEVLDFMLQLIEAVEYAHSKGVYHRDIKPENILIASDGSVRLADWGLATTIRINSEFGVGSERYMAPELFDQKNIDSYDAEKVDIWSIGICLLNILFARNPFTSACQKDKLFLDFASSREALFDIFPSLSDDTFTALRYCLTLDPDNRSLSLFRDALYDVESWTTDEEEYYSEYDDDLSRNVSVLDMSTPIAIDESNRHAITSTTNTASVTAPAPETNSSTVVDSFAEDKATSGAASVYTTATTAPMTIINPNNLSTQDLTSLATTAPPKPTAVHAYNPPNNQSLLSANLISIGASSIPIQTRNIVPTSNNREPLRTPSALSEQLVSESMLSKAWNRTMQFTPPNPSYFADPRNSATFSGGNSKRGDDYINSQHTSSFHNDNKPIKSSRLMESVTEENYDDDDGHLDIFSMDEIDTALNHIDDSSSMYSVPSLVTSQDDSFSVSSSRRSANYGNSVDYSMRKAAAQTVTKQVSPTSQIGNTTASTLAITSDSPGNFQKASPFHQFNDADVFGQSWADIAGGDDDDFDIYKVTHALETTPMYVGSPTNPLVRVAVLPNTSKADDDDDDDDQRRSESNNMATPALNPNAASSKKPNRLDNIPNMVPASRRHWVSTWS